MHYLILTVYWVSLPYTLANNLEPNSSLVHGMKPFISHQIFSERFFRRLTCHMKSSPITNFLHFIPLKGASLILGMAQCLKEILTYIQRILFLPLLQHLFFSSSWTRAIPILPPQIWVTDCLSLIYFLHYTLLLSCYN